MQAKPRRDAKPTPPADFAAVALRMQMMLAPARDRDCESLLRKLPADPPTN